ncbi:MAG: hypothetical protein Q7J57_09995 [Gemmobacter sp.]|nr:hypothetical protein [Gemmobacter sp.]
MPSLPDRRNGNGSALWRNLFRLLLLVVLVWLLGLAFGWLMDLTKQMQNADGLRIALIAALLLAYVVMLAIPFVPGIEFGLALLALHGAQVAPYVYGATVVGLLLAFSVGAIMPYRWLIASLSDMRLFRAADAVARIEGMDRASRQKALASVLPRRIGGFAAGHPYLVFALLLNVPGSAVIGGGGGIALLAGLSGLYHWGATLVTIALAVAPVPILIWALDLRLPI